jgi:hypothetical protein
MAKGRHADSGGLFYRDLAFMVLGILAVGVVVFFALFWLVGDGSTTETTVEAAPTTTTSTVVPTTVTSTTIAATTTTTSDVVTTTTVPLRPPEEVHVVVLNSIAVAGAAGRFTETLEEAGYQTLPASDFEPEQDPSKIWYREGFSAEANTMLEFLPDADVEPLPDEELQPGADVVVVLGTGYEE